MKKIGTILILVIMSLSFFGAINVIGIAPPIGDFHIVSCSGHIYRDDTGAPLSEVKVKLVSPETGAYKIVYTDSTGYYYVSMKTMEYTYFSLTVSKSGFQTKSTLIYSSGSRTINFYLSPIVTVERIAAFFYHPEITSSIVINKYKDQLQNEEGFTVFRIYSNPVDWQSKIDEIDALEGPEDYVMLYFFAHGHESYSSQMKIATDSNGNDVNIHAMYLRDKITVLDSNNIFVFVESCFSGGFVSYLQQPNLCIITAADTTQAHGFGTFGYNYEGYFSYKFFEYLHYNWDINKSFNNARSWIAANYPEQEPLKNNQLPETWFINW